MKFKRKKVKHISKPIRPGALFKNAIQIVKEIKFRNKIRLSLK